MTILFIIKMKDLMLIKWSYMSPPNYLAIERKIVIIFLSLQSNLLKTYVVFVILFLEPHQTTCHSNIGVLIRKETKQGYNSRTPARSWIVSEVASIICTLPDLPLHNMQPWDQWVCLLLCCIYCTVEVSLVHHWSDEMLIIWMKAFHKAQQRIRRISSQLQKWIENKNSSMRQTWHCI